MIVTRLSPCLAVLRGEVNARWPGRDKASDGWLGDAAHAARASDHNPDRDGSVNAFDFDKDGVNVALLMSAFISDNRTEYVIWQRRIYRRVNNFRPEYYSGANGHYQHIHVSIRNGFLWENDKQTWLTTETAPINDAPAPINNEENYDMGRIIEALYRRYLNRNASESEIDHWLMVAVDGNLNLAALRKLFIGSRSETGTVIAAYVRFLGRAPSAVNIAEWSDAETISQTWDGISNSPEAVGRRRSN